MEELPDGSLRGPEGVIYRRTQSRLKRAEAAAYVNEGAAVVTNVYPEGLRLFTGEAARNAWSVIAPRLVIGRPPRVTDLQWVGHLWQSDDGAVLLRFDGQH